ncbi:unnamed protein product [Blepharisma stoltei]|uniref:Pyruvate kinase n=1 Tax=Blepharisma stoltei TaxID=1481888 RepID=A0AAU9JG46_9CILI|nr:unnamed protein product [Blepharisma stoltei]
MARITAIGRIDDSRFQKVKKISEDLHESAQIEIEIQGHFESQLDPAIKSLMETLQIQFLKDQSLIVTLDDHYLGSLEELESWAFTNFHYFDHTPFSFYEKQSRIQKTKTIMNSENIFVELAIAMDRQRKPVIIELFHRICPKSCQEFIELCLEKKKNSKGEILSYKGTPFNRVVQGCYIMGGYLSQEYDDSNELNSECFQIKHDREGLVGVTRKGKGLFYITLRSLPHLDRKYIIIGKVVEGMETVRAINEVELNYQHPISPPILAQTTLLPKPFDIFHDDLDLLHYYVSNISRILPDFNIIKKKIASKPITEEAGTLISQRSVIDDMQKQKEGSRKTKIVCTLGPACSEVPIITKLIENGMNVARLNLAHGDKKSHEEILHNLDIACEQTGEEVAVMVDTKGPEVRTGINKKHAPIALERGQELEITTDRTVKGTKNIISITSPEIFSYIKIGSTVLISDGGIICETLDIRPSLFKVRVISASVPLLEHQNITVLGSRIGITKRVVENDELLLELVSSHKIDFVAISFTQRKQDVIDMRQLLGENGKFIKIIGKIENIEGLENTEEIVKESDGVMVARGDLGMNLPNEKVFLAQKFIISIANQYAKPVLTATQMLESMIKNPRPTRAEASDIANAIIDGTDAVMLSSETCIGQFPIEALTFMSKICLEAEKYQETLKKQIKGDFVAGSREGTCKAAANISNQRGANVIVVFSDRGGTARLVEKYRPKAPIFVLSTNEATIRQLKFYRNLWGIKIEKYEQLEVMINNAFEELKRRLVARSGDHAVIVYGHSENNPNKADALTFRGIP